MRPLRNACTAAVVGALLLPAAALAAQPAATPLDGRPPLAPDRSRDPLPDPEAKPLSLGKVELGARPDVIIREIRFVGAGVPANVGRAAQRFVGKPASSENLAKLAAAMTRAYNRSSVALFTLVIPEQDLSGGVVTVASAEGYIGSVTLSGERESGPAPLVGKMAGSLAGQRPLPRARFERALGNIADIPGVTVTPTLALGGAQGAVALDLAVDAKKPTIGLGFTTRTSQFVNDGIVEANARGASLLRSGDETRLTGAAALNLKSLLYLAASHSTPIGAGGTRAELSGAALRTRPKGLAIDGEAWSAGFGVTHPLIRASRRNLLASARIDYLDSKNALFGSTIAAEKTWTASGSLAFRLSEERTVVGARIGGAKGLDIAGARVDPGVGETGFAYADASLEANRAIGKAFVVRAAATGRWTRDRLPAAQRFSVGGATFGRAFEDGLVNGDRGYAAFGEFALRPLRSGRFSKSEIYSFVDYADVTLLGRTAIPRTGFELGSWGGGVRVAYAENATIGLELADPWKQPVPGYDQDLRVALSWKLSLRP
ncbi:MULTISPECIES: ShlB/FhaC/HecB family hemolysin secretion/activation protein [unclassified Sphingopyxis]|jgi:hemolysin activation/secretion protein|uniref:ShlB/FhaC/HecB family hemolysin secretion/activation protein n=1 Tax=unclassified Sphingopyxis TaxID=2614943 RepID=UPI0006C17CDC|nr:MULTISPECIES: ShlB/FhaC/HecB family hemolysin secretion/activation protein [unclassified Sphingopyxis]USI77387.1 ShlB/FhaC/HecB family hemolysin secretion/activation protein [Sphingopyxis sp. USTB-05]GAO80131.1 hemolysin activation/secretion protein [Sphingopyxis sp. C-1]